MTQENTDDAGKCGCCPPDFEKMTEMMAGCCPTMARVMSFFGGRKGQEAPAEERKEPEA